MKIIFAVFLILHILGGSVGLITGTINLIRKKGDKKHKLLAIKYMPDHVHILIGYQPSQPLPDLVRDIKANISRFINDQKWLPGTFRWQEGYGAFSYSHSQIDNVIKYINNQEEHHLKSSFKDEYLNMLEKYEVQYDPEYLFEWI